MPASLLQTRTGTGSSPTTTLTWTGNTTTGSTIIVLVGVASGSVATGITDSQLNSYTKADGVATGSIEGSIWYAPSITGGATPTITVTTTSIFGVTAIAREYAGLSSSPLDPHVVVSGSGASLATGALGASTRSDELLVAYAADTASIPTARSDYSNAASVTNGINLVTAQKIVKGITSGENATFTGLSSDLWVCGVASFIIAPVNPYSKPTRPRPFTPGIAR